MDIIIRHNYLVIEVSAIEDNTSIKDSYRVKNISEMKVIINKIRAEVPEDMAVHTRSMFGMINEWRAHNLLYTLGIKKDRTGTVDLDTNEPWYRKVGYAILSPFYLHFI